MESEKLNMTARYRYWYKVWMDDSESWVYKDEIGELDVCCGENEVYDKVQEHLRTGAFAYPAIGLGFRIVDGFQGPTYAFTDDMSVNDIEYCNGFIRVHFYDPNGLYKAEMLCKKVLFIG